MKHAVQRLAAVVICILVTTAGACAQTTLKEWQVKFVGSFCICLETYSIGLKPGQMLYEQTETCIRGFFRDHAAAYESFGLADSTLATLDLSPYEKGKLMGKRLMLDGIVMMVNECPVYRRALSEFKHILISQVLKPNDSINKIIDQFKDVIPEVSDRSKLGKLYLFIALLHEYAARKEEALEWYDKSLDIEQTTTARGLKTLLLYER